jgi:type III secretion protein N (ATPase)
VRDAALRRAALDGAGPLRLCGRLTRLSGLALEAALDGVRLGEVCRVATDGEPLLAEVVGLRPDGAVLLPLGEAVGVGLGAEVRPTGHPLLVGAGEGLLGRVLDGLGRPIDGRPLPAGLAPWPVDRSPPAPLRRGRIGAPFLVGLRAVDGLLTLGRGQRLGLFAGAGVGKSSLLGRIARAAAADVRVICLIGERGREVREFVEDALGPVGLAGSVVVAATSDAPPLVRLRAAQVASALAEWFAEAGREVLLLCDSLTRFARAQREVGLAAGEPPARQGYPASVFQALPRLVERAGPQARGCITAVYAVLVAGHDQDEPIADEIRGLLDGHLVLERRLAERGHYPAIDVLASVSRVMDQVAAPAHRAAAVRVRALLATWEQQRDLVLLGAYRRGADAAVDRAVERWPAIEAFLRQDGTEVASLEVTLARLEALAA